MKNPKDEDIVDLVKSDLEERANFCEKKYGNRLKVNTKLANGKSELLNAYEEVLDLAMYLRKEMQKDICK